MFDISDPAHPVRISRLVQSGSKAMTRLSDGHLYVFSDYEPWQEIYRLEEKGTDHGIGFSEEDIDQYVPSADGEVLPQERLYLPKDTTAREYLVMTSVDVEKPDEFSDRAATLGWSNTFYMGTEYIYMISADYDDVPANADFAVRIHGSSMEPYIRDGDTIYVERTSELNVGDVGIFSIDGSMYCKLYYIDSSGNMTLVSANPDYAESNVFVSAESNISVECCGRVILSAPIPMPDYFLTDDG